MKEDNWDKLDKALDKNFNPKIALILAIITMIVIVIDEVFY